MFALACAAIATFVYALFAKGALDGGTIAKAATLVGGEASLYSRVGTSGFAAIAALVLLGLIAFKAARSASLEIFFFSLWCFALCLELGAPLAYFLSAGGEGMAFVSFALRAGLFGRYLSFAALFSGSLFPAGLRSERALALFWISLLGAMFFSSIHPLNQGTSGSLVTVEVGYGLIVGFMEIGLALLAAVNYCIAWRENRDKTFLKAGIGAAACMAGAALIRASTSLPMALMVIFLISLGSWTHLRSLYAYYLWR